MTKNTFSNEFITEIMNHLDAIHTLAVENNCDHLSMCVFSDYYNAFHIDEEADEVDLDIAKQYTEEEEVDD
jgi:hypothetical protein